MFVQHIEVVIGPRHDGQRVEEHAIFGNEALLAALRVDLDDVSIRAGIVANVADVELVVNDRQGRGAVDVAAFGYQGLVAIVRVNPEYSAAHVRGGPGGRV